MASRTENEMRPERLQEQIKRWNGNARITTYWNGLHKDPDLWLDDDCFIHLYAAGQSQRGPSFCLQLSTIKSKYCGLSMGQIFGYSSRNDPKRHRHLLIPRSGTSGNDANNHREKYDLYLPAPTDKGKEETFRYHLVSRNIFAWMFNKPIVGTHLGNALICLLERLNGYRSNEEVNMRDVLRYMKDMGYLDFRKCSDHALALLQFAEHFQMADLWADAFAHCIGMEEILRRSTEFGLVSRTSKLFIQRAVRGLRLRLEQAADDLSTFFKDRLSETYLGLSDAARDHLDRFRSFLHTFYLGKYGHWPPLGFDGDGELNFPKETYRSLYFDFRCLYEYLVDIESTPSMQDNKLVSGGLCVLQNVSAFDRRNGYQTLLHPLPLLPGTTSASNGIDSRWVASLRPFGPTRQPLRTKSCSRGRVSKLATVRALVLARNNRLDLMATAIVQEYSRFEKLCTLRSTEKVSAADGRKVRWLLIYTVLQTLVSINEAPREVTQREGVPYPLCCHIPNLRPWSLGGPDSHGFRPKLRRTPKVESQKKETQSSIKYPYYLSTRRSESSADLDPQGRNSLSSVRNLRQLLTDASRCHSQKCSRSSNATKATTAATTTKKKNPAFCEIIVYGYGNGLNQTVSEASNIVLQRHETRRKRPQQAESKDQYHTNHPTPLLSCPSSARSEYSSQPGLTDDSSSRNSTTTITTTATADVDTDRMARPTSRITIKHNSYTSLISNPYSSSSNCSGSVRDMEVAVDGVVKRPVYQAIRCTS